MPLWGTSRWGTRRWGEGVVGHVMTVGGSVSFTAFAIQLRHSHILDASGRMAFRTQVIGMGPKPIHPLAAVAIMDVATGGSFLAIHHILDAIGKIDVVGGDAALKLQHTMATTGLIDFFQNGAALSIHHLLAATGKIELAAMATDLDLSHPLVATGKINMSAHGAWITILPVPIPVEFTGIDPHSVIHGTVNLVGNPTLDVSITDWYGRNGATVTRVTDHAWHGTSAARTVMTGAILDEGLAVRTYQSLGITPYQGSLLWGQIRLAAAGIPLTYFVRAYYTDETVVEATRETAFVDATGVGDDWHYGIAPPLLLDPTKVLKWAEIGVVRETPGSGTFWADGAMVEYDKYMYGPSLWIIGNTEAAVFAEFA